MPLLIQVLLIIVECLIFFYLHTHRSKFNISTILAGLFFCYQNITGILLGTSFYYANNERFKPTGTRFAFGRETYMEIEYFHWLLHHSHYITNYCLFLCLFVVPPLFEQMTSKRSGDSVFKILFIGDSAVGKTCLITKFCNKEFSSNFMATIG